MELKELVERFEPQTKVKIIEKDEVLFEGAMDTLEKLLKAKVKKHGCTNSGDGIVVNVAEYV